MYWGLSPRGRGNQPLAVSNAGLRVYPRVGWGTVPEVSYIGNGLGVYPRVGGGTLRSLSFVSPNPTAGSIPAWAGEPHQSDAIVKGHARITGSIPAWAGEPGRSKPTNYP